MWAISNRLVVSASLWDIDGLVQERRNSSAYALDFRLSCTNPSICNLVSGFHQVISVGICQGCFLTHWDRATHICVGKKTFIGSDNGLSPGRCQAVIWTNAGIWLIRPLVANFREILIEIDTFSFKKMHLQIMASPKWHPFCLNVVSHQLQRACYIPDFLTRHWIISILVSIG